MKVNGLLIRAMQSRCDCPAAQAATDLHAKALLPAHVGRFSIARHAWNEPFERIRMASQTRSYTLLTPMIGQALQLDDKEPAFAPWWVPATTPSLSSTSLNTPGASS